MNQGFLLLRINECGVYASMLWNYLHKPKDKDRRVSYLDEVIISREITTQITTLVGILARSTSTLMHAKSSVNVIRRNTKQSYDQRNPTLRKTKQHKPKD